MEKSFQEKAKQKLVSIAAFIKDIPRKRPLLGLVLLSFFAIFAILFLDSLGDRQSKEGAGVGVGEENLQEGGPLEGELTEDYQEGFSISTPNYARERAAYKEYRQEIQERSKGDSSTGSPGEDMHFDGSAAKRREDEQFVRSLSGMYSLPYRGKTMQAKYVRVLETAAGTRYLISIGHLESRAQADREWKEYLRRQGDSGQYYVLQYYKLPH